MGKKRGTGKQFTLSLTPDEQSILEIYCDQVCMSQTHVARQLIRDLESKLDKASQYQLQQSRADISRARLEAFKSANVA